MTIVPPPKLLKAAKSSLKNDAPSQITRARFTLAGDAAMDAHLRPLIGTWFPGSEIKSDLKEVSTADALPNESTIAENERFLEIRVRQLAKGDWASECALDTPVALISRESYAIVRRADAFLVTGASKQALVWALQSLRQLDLKEIANQTAPGWALYDEPRFAWRGCLLDCSRHFMPVPMVLKFIDLLSYHKMNRFHWHLVDDQGWRIDIPKYPLLAQVGAWRPWTEGAGDHGATMPRDVASLSLKGTPKVYGGFYTKEEVRQVVAFASARGVMVVPEIEMPGHCVATLASYNWLGCVDRKFAVPTEWGVFEDVYCAGKESTFTFLQDVLDYVCEELFPESPYIHIGGDECPKTRWKQCALCQQRMRDEKLKDEHELQSWFIRRIGRYLATKNRALIGWDEILEGGLSPGATVQSWRSFDGATEAAKLGHGAVVSPTSHCYLDYPLATLDIRQCFRFDPVPADLPPVLHPYIHGGEACMWTERAPPSLMLQKVYPRLCAIAMALWTPTAVRQRLTFERFHADLVQHHLPRLKRDFGLECGDGLAQRPKPPQPGWQVSTTMGVWQDYYPELALSDDTATYYWSNRAPVPGDLFCLEFTQHPVVLHGVRLDTGKPMAPAEDRLRGGLLEVQVVGDDRWHLYADIPADQGAGSAQVYRHASGRHLIGVRGVRLRVVQSHQQWLVIRHFQPVLQGGNF